MNKIDPSKMTDEEYEAYNNYIQSFQPIPVLSQVHRDYRFETGFRFKKVMYAYRQENKGRQYSIYVTFNKHDFNCSHRDVPNKVQNSNYVKVSPVVLPLIDPVKRNRIQEMADFCKDNRVYGIFFFATRKPNYENAPWTVDEFHGKLWVYIKESIERKVSNITAIFPYYNYRGPEYKVYLLFNHSRDYRDYHQNRLTKYEIAPGVREMNEEYAKGNMEYQFQRLSLHSNNRYAAIYVDQFTTLTVIFENNHIQQNPNVYPYRRGFPRPLCHERVLIQRGGLVGLEKYDLRYQFMDSPRIYYNLRELAQSNRIRPVDNTDMRSILNPLIVLGSPTDTTNQPNKQSPYPSYGLSVENTHRNRIRKPATLLLPTGARILTVRDFYPDWFDETGNCISSNGYRHVTDDLWTAAPYEESTGPYADANAKIEGHIRSAFINGVGPCLAP